MERPSFSSFPCSARRYSRLALLVPALIATPLTCLTVTCLPAIDSQILVTSYYGGDNLGTASDWLVRLSR
jgi:hypothetical protein